MDYHPPWQQVSGNAAEVYERQLVPAMLAPWASTLIDLTEVQPGMHVLVGASVEWLEASALEMPLPDASFDVVLCQHGLQQFPDRAAALREMRRVLKGDGRLAASVWSRIEGSPGMAALV